MKKIALLLSAMALTFGAFAAEKGDMGVGVNVNAVPCLESGIDITNFGIGAKFQYNLTNPIRLEAAFNYDLKDKGVSVVEVGVNGNYIFNVTNKLQVYPLVGVGYANLKGVVSFDFDDIEDYGRGRYDDDDDDIDISSSVSRLYVNAGLGAEYNFSNNLSANLEVKYQYMKDFNRLPISIGVTYHF